MGSPVQRSPFCPELRLPWLLRSVEQTRPALAFAQVAPSAWAVLLPATFIVKPLVECPHL